MTDPQGSTMRSPASMRGPVLWVIILAGMMMMVMTYSLVTDTRTVAVHGLLADAAMEIKFEAALFHLWFEEIISGDRNEDVPTVWNHLDQCDWYARAMLDGDENSEGVFSPLEDPLLRREIEDVLTKISDFRVIAEERWMTSEQSEIGSEIDQRFDAVFEDFLAQADEVETSLQTAIFPGVIEFGLLEVLHRVWRTGKPEHFPISWYEDDRIEGWRENYIYRLPSGEVVTIYDDLTERKRAEAELENHREHLEELVEERTAALQVANKDLEDFAYSVSHDLKAPLRAITGFSEIISRRHRESLNEESRRYFDHIQVAGVNMNRLIEGRSLFDLFPKEAERYYEDDLEVIRTGKAKLGILEPLQSSTGETGWFITDKIPHCDAAGEVIGVTVFAIDITERKRVEDKMEKRSEELRTMVNVMAGRENRMAELKETIRKLRAQLEDEGMTPVADDPLIEGRRGKSEG
ncbi:MAG: PAS domain-containing protein [Thermoanaerobaculales bacterium]|nr:PAS domain-containing protein [Thermoanaerobaculales bacterium]